MYIALRFVNPSVLYKWVSVCLPSKDQDDDNDDPDIRSAHSLNLMSAIVDILMTSGKTRARENWNITIVGRRLVDIRENPRNIKELLRVRD